MKQNLFKNLTFLSLESAWDFIYGILPMTRHYTNPHLLLPYLTFLMLLPFRNPG